MKKILIMFLLAFPILIFAIVSFASTIIAYYVPIPVKEIKMVEGADIMGTALNEKYALKFQIGPEGARNNSFSVYDENGRVIVDYDDNYDVPTIVKYDDLIVDIVVSSNTEVKFISRGLVTLEIVTKNYGFTRLTIVTADGKYETYSDIYVADPSASPSEIQGIVFDYTKVHENYQFGNKNSVTVGYTYYPKMAFGDLTEEKKKEINNELIANANNITFDLKNIILRSNNVNGDGRGELTLELQTGAVLKSKNLTKNSEYSFNVNDGYNIYTYEDILKVNTLGANLYLLNNIIVSDYLVFRNGTKVYGNEFKLDHSTLKYYEEKNADGTAKNINRYAIEFNGNNSGLYNTHVLGALDKNNQPYENIINVGMIATNNDSRTMEVKDSIIENGRFNLTVKGYSNTNELVLENKATKFILENNTFIGAYLASVEVESSPVDAYKHYATNVEISKTKISYTAIGVVIQNTRNSGGVMVVNFVRKDNEDAVTSTSWRNLDDASGALSMNNFGYILKELKSSQYSDVYYRDGKDYYVNPVIMIRGGYINRGIINFEDETFEQNLIGKERVPSFIEAMHPSIGGTYPFTIYLLNPEYYHKGDK